MKTKAIRSGIWMVFSFLLLFNQIANSQILISLLLGDKLNSDNLEFGLEGGYNWSDVSGIDEAKGMGNFHLGFYFDIRIKNNWFINTGVRVKSNSGATKINPYSLGDNELDSVFIDGYIRRVIGYFYVPLHVKLKFSRQFFAVAGIQAGLRNQAKDLFRNTYYDKDDVEFKYDIRDEVKRLDAGLSGGLGYKFKGTGMNLGVTYYYGLVDIAKSDDLNSKNSSIYIYLDIPIGAGYREKP
jgi:hypothetical protein